MANALKQSLGKTGKMVESSSQDFVAKHLNVSKGACMSMCAKFMCDISNIEMPTEKDYLEAAQWVQEGPGWMTKIDMMAKTAGLNCTKTMKGRLLTDELYIGEFLKQVGKRPSFNMFGFDNTGRTEGHEILLYTWADDDWVLFDPNFGWARWPYLSGVMIGLKRLLDNGYRDMGPYYPFDIFKYEKA